MAQPYSLVQGGSSELAQSENNTIKTRGVFAIYMRPFQGKEMPGLRSNCVAQIAKKVLTTTGNNIPRGATQSVGLRNY